MKKITVSETIELDENMNKAYDAIKVAFEIYRTKENMKYSFDEYLLRCGLTSLLSSFEKQLESNKIVEGHA